MCRWTAAVAAPVTALTRTFPALPAPRALPAAAFAASLLLTSPALAQTMPAGCFEQLTPGARPSADLYCIDLVAAPDFPDARGAAELGRAQSPFGVAVDRDGTHLFDLRVSAEGLPDPTTVAGATAYVAWVTTPTLWPLVRLGEVGGGVTATGRVAFDKFLVLISAEASLEVTERTGPLVLRGTSASTRMLPFDEQYLLVAGGGAGHAGHETDGAPETPGQRTTHAGDHARPPAGTEWTMPPMHPRVPMPPGMDHLRPSVTPFLPAAAPGEAVVDGIPSRALRVADGDTIDLTAQRVRFTLGEREVTMYGYNGQIPGPLIRAEQDATIVVRLHNSTEFPTAVHWHGLRLDNRFDGVPGVTQAAVAPGASFIYEVNFPDPGLYWYHPHLREDVTQSLGLYGNLRVDSPNDSHLRRVDREEVWMLSDLLVDDQGLYPYGQEAPTHALMGRFGNVILLNGVPAGGRMEIDRGEVVRFLLTNVANVRTFNLSFGGAPIRLIASDLSHFEREEWVESVVIAPAERYVVEVRFDEPGDFAVENRVRAIDHMYGSFFQEVDTIALVRVKDRGASPIPGDADPLRTHDDVVAGIDALRPHFDRPPDRELILSQEVGELDFPLRQLMQNDSAYFNPVEWSGTMPDMDWAVTSNEVTWTLRDPESGRENMEIDWRFREGDLVRLRIRNERDVLHAMQHPIHIHGQRFLVLSLNGVPGDNLVWKDTFLLPVGWTAELLVEMTNPGDWMIHCHIAEHLESGMMATFRVDPKDREWDGWEGYVPGSGHHLPAPSHHPTTADPAPEIPR